MERRRFLSWVTGLLGACAAALAGVPVLGFLVAPLRLKHAAGKVGFDLSLVPPDTFRRLDFNFWEQQGYVPMKRTVVLYARRAGDGVVVYSAVCTHAGCPVGWDPAKREFHCPCHGGKFGEDGAVTKGPPTKPLRRLPAAVEGDTVTVDVPPDLIG
jgi:Rieske Fe-S protein